MSAGKGDRNRTADWHAWRDSPVWRKTTNQEGVKDAHSAASDTSQAENQGGCRETNKHPHPLPDKAGGM